MSVCFLCFFSGVGCVVVQKETFQFGRCQPVSDPLQATGYLDWGFSLLHSISLGECCNNTVHWNWMWLLPYKSLHAYHSWSLEEINSVPDRISSSKFKSLYNWQSVCLGVEPPFWTHDHILSRKSECESSYCALCDERAGLSAMFLGLCQVHTHLHIIVYK
jgi:hypothetical protein